MMVAKPTPPLGAKPMDAELGRRLRGYIDGTEWWKHVRDRISLAGMAGLPAFIVSGTSIKSPSDDFTLANAVDWALNRSQIEIASVGNYQTADWYYLDPAAAPFPPGRNFGIWGWVDVTLVTALSVPEAEAKAKLFARTLLPSFGSETLEPPTMLDTDGYQYRVEGRIYV